MLLVAELSMHDCMCSLLTGPGQDTTKTESQQPCCCNTCRLGNCLGLQVQQMDSPCCMFTSSSM